MRAFSPSARSLIVVVSATWGFGCDEEKPYTPFQVATALPQEADQPQPQSESTPASPVPRAEGEQAPPERSQWRLGETDLNAPTGYVFSSGLQLTLGDSELLLAWILPKKDRKTPETDDAGLYLFDASGRPKTKLAGVSSRLPSGDDCRYSTHLRNTGGETVSSTVQCRDRLLPDTPNQQLTIVRPDKSPFGVFEVLMAESAPGETVVLEVDSSDRDGDGRDDVELNVALTAPDGTREQLPLRWLSRSAGVSRQADAPLQELSKRVSELSTRSVQKAHREKVPDQVDTLRRLLSTMCEELGTARLTLANGAKVKCGDIWPFLVRLAHSATQAHVGSGEIGAALGEIQRAEWWTHKLNEKELKSLSQLVAPRVSKGKLKQIARFDVTVKSEPAPHHSPLYFLDDGQLFAQLSDGKTKRLTMRGDPPLASLDPSAESEPPDKTAEEPSSKMPSWDLIPKGPGGRYLTAAVPSCERSEVQLVFGRKSGDPLPSVPLPVLAPRPGNCRSYSGFALTPEVLTWEAGQVAVLLGGQVFWSSGKPHALPMEVAWGSELGLVVKDGEKFSLLETDHAADLHHCVVAPQIKRIACLRGPSVYVFSKESGSDP